MDSADVAQIEQDRAMERFERAQAARVDTPSLSHCIHCEEAIPAARRERIAGVETCVDCQTLIERGAVL